MRRTGTDEHEGQSCGATSDCGGALKCIDKVCTSGAAPRKNKDSDDSREANRRALGEWLDFKLEGTHPYVGFTWTGGFMTTGVTGGGFSVNSFNGNFLFALHGGVFFDNHQLHFEIAPITYFWNMRGGSPVFEMNGSYGYFIPLYEDKSVSVY